MFDLVFLIPLFPLAGFLINGLFGAKLKNEKLIGSISSAVVGLSFIVSCLLFFEILSAKTEKPIIVPLFQWITTGSLDVSFAYQIDRLSVMFSMVVTGVGFLIHVYSIGYMHGDRSFSRFFAYMNLFIFMMLNLVLGSSFLLTFLGWEGVGLCSYLLIGFWYDRKFDGVNITWTGDAGMKAFIVNRIGYFAFIIAMFLIFITFGTLDYSGVMSSAADSADSFYATGIITAITLLLFLGCTGKSAQIPLAVWLPDAMAGPTPVSALIHAATMVTAGIFLIARSSVLFALSPVAMNVVVIIGIATALWAATIGIVQNDIKKVLAYSTVSQLGFMFAALGVGAFSAAVFHVMTHAFFKGLLFLGAGAVIHGLHEEQNIKKMGGLKSHMPWTFKTFFVATLAISGIPFFSGFFSKDEILWSVFSKGGWFGWLVLALAAFCTAFYMFRLVYLVFFGEERFDHKHVHPHEAPKTMTIPLVVLSILSALGGFLGVPYALGFWASEHPNILESWLAPVFHESEKILNVTEGHSIHAIEYVFMLVSVVIAVMAIIIAKRFYSDPNWTKPKAITKSLKPFHSMLWNKYWIDELYNGLLVNRIKNGSRKLLWKGFDVGIIDGIVNGTAALTMKLGEILKFLQSGIIQKYGMLMVAGIIAILLYLMLM